MAFYRHKPILTPWQKAIVTGAIVLLLLLPALINFLLPQIYNEKTPVMLGASGWELPLMDENQQPMECVRISEVDISKQWDCSDFLIETTVVNNGDSPKLTLRRAYRAFSPANVYPEGAEIDIDGRVHSLTFEGYSAVTFDGAGDNEGESIFVLFMASDHDKVLELVKGSLR